MKCEECRELLSWYLERDLGFKEMKDIEVHLSICEGCADDLKLLKEAIGLAKGLPQIEPPHQTCLQLLEKVKASVRFEKVIYIWRRIPSTGRTGIFFFEKLLPASQKAGLNYYLHQARTVKRLDGTWWKFVKVRFLVHAREGGDVR
jgi:hypothetical protein